MRRIWSILLLAAIFSIFQIFNYNRLTSIIEHPVPSRCKYNSNIFKTVLIDLRDNSTAARKQCYSYENKSKEIFGTFCFPSIVTAGFPKCGTSYLFKLLSKHSKVRASRRKELCYGGIKAENWSKYFSMLPNVDESYGKYVLTGCLHLGANIEAASSLCITNTKYVLVLRDIADMLWAAFNYWCIVDFDDDCIPGGRTKFGFKRSPELFHDFMMRNASLGGGYGLDISGNCYRKDLEAYIRLVGSHNVFVINSQQLLNPGYNSSGVNNSDALGLSSTGVGIWSGLKPLFSFLELDVADETELLAMVLFHIDHPYHQL